MNAALAQLALIFLPGIIWARLDATYGSGPKVDKATLALNSFMFGISTYALVYVLYWMINVDFSTHAISETGLVSFAQFADEVLISIPVSFMLAVLWLYCVRYRLVMRFLNWVGATRRFGTEDVWSFTFNSNQKHVEYVDVRDTERGYIFSGYVNAYSESEDMRELLLLDAIIYDDDGDEVTCAPHLYLSLNKESAWIEFPHQERKDVKKRT